MRRSTPPTALPYAASYTTAPPPPPWWRQPAVFFIALGLIVAVAALLLFLTAGEPSDELTSDELRTLMAEPAPTTDLPPRFDTPSRLADLSLRTEPAGAVLLLDGAEVGRSPVQLQDIRPGFYTVRAEADAHAALDTTFYLASGALLELELALHPFAVDGTVTPDTPSNAPRPLTERRTISAQGRAAGGSTGGSNGGSASRASESGPEEAAPTFGVATPDQVLEASHTGSLSITSNPLGADVLVDGVPFGQTPLSLRALRPGSYVVTLSFPGLDPLTYQAEVTAQAVAVVKGSFGAAAEANGTR